MQIIRDGMRIMSDTTNVIFNISPLFSHTNAAIAPYIPPAAAPFAVDAMVFASFAIPFESLIAARVALCAAIAASAVFFNGSDTGFPLSAIRLYPFSLADRGAF